MSDKNREKQMHSFIAAMRQRSAARILELGTIDELFIGEVLREFDWADAVEVHCLDNGSESFDASLTRAMDGKMLDVQVTKHIGSETEVNDAVLQASELNRFDAVFISSAVSSESLLTACMVCNECLKSGGIMGVSASVLDEQAMSIAMKSFQDLYADSYDEIHKNLFVKKAS